jgi:hypothetical protein
MENYERYGKAGVTVCERWQTFENFLADMGERPEGTTLERIDGTRGYEPGNCRWATKSEQARNRKSTVLTPELVAEGLDLHEDGMSYAEIGRYLGVRAGTIRAAIVGRTWQ